MKLHKPYLNLHTITEQTEFAVLRTQTTKTKFLSITVLFVSTLKYNNKAFEFFLFEFYKRKEEGYSKNCEPNIMCLWANLLLPMAI